MTPGQRKWYLAEVQRRMVEIVAMADLPRNVQTVAAIVATMAAACQSGTFVAVDGLGWPDVLEGKYDEK